jgi:hypothetical protein
MYERSAALKQIGEFFIAAMKLHQPLKQKKGLPLKHERPC